MFAIQLMRPIGHKWFLSLLLAVVIAAGAFFIIWGHPPAYYLTIYDGRTEEILARKEVNLDDVVLYDYIHSADGTPVRALFAVEKEGLRLVEERYSWYGAGLESGAGYDFSFQEEEVIVSGYDRLFKRLPLRVARTVTQKLYLGEEVITLNQLAPGGSLLIIRVEKE